MKSENTSVNMKLKIVNLVVGLIIGALLSAGIFLLVGNNSYYKNMDRNGQGMPQMDFENRGQMNGDKIQMPDEGGRVNPDVSI